MAKKRTNSRKTEKSRGKWVNSALAFAHSAIADTKYKKHGKMIRQAAQRFIDDLKRAKKKDCAFYFDEWHANDVCDFIEKLPHVEGKWDTGTIVLHPAQCFLLVQLFGFRKKMDGTRRYTSCLYATARKSGKSTLAGAIGDYCLCCEDENGAQVISAATTFPQASIIFNISKKMVERTPDLEDAFGLKAWAKAISRYETGSTFKPIHAKASTQDGLNPSHVLLDEIHAHKNADLVNVLASAAGTRTNPLWLYVTTEGYINAGPWSDQRKFAKQILEGIFKPEDVDHYLVVFFAIDDEDKNLGINADDEFDEKCWIKANPLIDVNPHLLTAIRKEATEAKAMPSKLAEFRIKRLNRSSSTADGWINIVQWLKCGGPIDLAALKDVPCWGGLDLSSTTDLTSFRLLWRVENLVFTYGWRWAPQAAISQRTERGTVPYASWVAQGLIQQTEGDVVDYSVIEAKIKEVKENFNLQNIAYDRWNAIDLVNRLVDAKIPMIEFVQGPKSYHPAMQGLERCYISNQLRHGGDPVLGWCASNIVARRDVNLNMAPDKRKSADKIDDITALLMSFGISMVPEAKSDYQVYFI